MTVAILAGGRSRRMGRDKAAIEFEGAPILERVASAAIGAALPTLVIGRERPGWWRIEPVRFLDEPDHRGPLSGLECALRESGDDIILLPCDMPRLGSKALLWLAGSIELAGLDGMISMNGSRPEPLFSIYRQSVLPLVEVHLTEGRLAMHELIARGRFGFVDLPVGVQGELYNVNRPEDLG